MAGGKRPFHTIIPGFLCDADGRPRMSFGVMGGNMQPQGHVQTLMRMLRHGQQPQAACDAPRWKVATGPGDRLRAHDGARPGRRPARAGPPLRGHVRPYMDFGSGQFIWRLSDDPDDGYVAASDSRRDGQAAGF